MINEKNKDVVVNCRQVLISSVVKNEDIIKAAEEFFGCKYFQRYNNWAYSTHYYLFLTTIGRPRIVGSTSKTPSDKDYVERVIDFDQMMLEIYSPALSETVKMEFNEELL